MKWEMLILAVIPLITAWIAYRRSGSERLIAVVATLASTGLVWISLFPESIRAFVHEAIVMAVVATALIAILTVAAGKLQHTSQWVAVSVGAAAIAAFFIGLYLSLINVDRALASKSTIPLPMDALAALLPLGCSIILGVPRIIGEFLKRRQERLRGERPRWRPSQWSAVGVGALIVAIALILTFHRKLAEGVSAFLLVTGLFTIVLVPQLIGFLFKMRETRAK
jgi:hypothetical protein